MDSIQSNMADWPLPVREMAKKPFMASISDSKFKLQLDMYCLQRKPSVFPSCLSIDSDGLITSRIRNEEVPLKSRSSSRSSNTTTSESIPAINVDDKHNEADLDSDDVFSNYKYTMGKVPKCSIYSCGLCELIYKSFREYLHHQKNDHNIKKEFYECAICNFATVNRQNLTDHKRSNCLSPAVDPHNSSHSSTDNASLEESENYIFAAPYLNSPQRNTTYIKAEAEELGKGNHATPTDDGGASLSLANATYMADEVFDAAGEVFDMADEVFKKTKKNTRQEVDPNKYFEVIDIDGVIFACSQCGNKYKWKKSLNKHWKEKHNAIQFLKIPSFPGLHKLLQTGKYTYIEHGRKLYDHRFLRTVQITGSDEASYASPFTSAHYYSHQSNKSPTIPIAHDWTSPDTLQVTRGTDSISTTHMANQGNSATIPQFPTHNNSYSPLDTDIQDLSSDPNQRSRNAPISRKHSEDRTLSSDQEQPMDLSSKNSSSSENNVPEMLRQNVLASSSSTPWSIKALSQRSSKSNFSTKSETESTTSFQMHKRVVVCFSCKLPLKSMEHLNNHFMTQHFQLLAKYKEAVKRIPHGLQQCYHLLDMDITDIAELSYQDLGSLDRTILTCNRCGFEAKGAADLQKHSLVHEEEKPCVCLVCGTKYMHKWDLVKHFERRHESDGLLNPYRRTDRKEASNSSEEEKEEPLTKKAKLEKEDSKVDSGLCNSNSAVSLEGIVGTISGRKATSSCQQNSLDLMTKMQNDPSVYKNTTSTEGTPKEQNTDHTAPKNYQSTDISTDKTVPHLPYAIQDTGIFKPNRTWGKDTKALEGAKLKHFQCPECKFTCVRLSQLEKHRRIHTDEKPFKCPTPNCLYRTKWKWDVTKHLARCGALGKSAVGKRSLLDKKKGRADRKSPQSTSPCSSQSINGNASPSNTEAQNDYTKADSKELSKKKSGKQNSGDVNYNCDHNNYTAETKNLQVTNLKQAIPVNTKKHNRSSGHSPSKMVWKCFHCPFTTHSQTTLKRHSLCHSEDKPFKCDVCFYSTRWTSDLKKHKRCHNHFLKRSESQEIEETHEEIQPRFKCFHCTLCFITLQELTDHHLTTHAAMEPSQASKLTVREVVDIARIKHPRKRTLYIQCPLLCPFIAPHSQMQAHLNEDIHCLFCRSLFQHKAYFFDHLITHVEFNPKEWEPYFRMSETEQMEADNDKTNQLPVENEKTHQRADYEHPGRHTDTKKSTHNYRKFKEDNNDKSKDYEHPGRHTDTKKSTHNYRKFKEDNNDKSTVDFSLLTCQPAARSSHILASQKELQLSMHTCDWCLEEFASLTAVYKHARLHHLSELNDQALEMAETVNESA